MKVEKVGGSQQLFVFHPRLRTLFFYIRFVVKSYFRQQVEEQKPYRAFLYGLMWFYYFEANNAFLSITPEKKWDKKATATRWYIFYKHLKTLNCSTISAKMWTASGPVSQTFYRRNKANRARREERASHISEALRTVRRSFGQYNNRVLLPQYSAGVPTVGQLTADRLSPRCDVLLPAVWLSNDRPRCLGLLPSCLVV